MCWFSAEKLCDSSPGWERPKNSTCARGLASFMSTKWVGGGIDFLLCPPPQLRGLIYFSSPVGARAIILFSH